MVVSKLAAILRVADALDSGHWQQVRPVRRGAAGRRPGHLRRGRPGADPGAAGDGGQGEPVRGDLRPEGAPGGGPAAGPPPRGRAYRTVRQGQTTMAETDLESPELYINRELSWLEFNDRVLQQGRSAERAADGAAEVPGHRQLQPRRVLHDPRGRAQAATGRRPVRARRQRPDPRPAARGHRPPHPPHGGRPVRRHRRQPCPSCAAHGLHLLDISEVTAEQRGFLESYFLSEVLPVLTPLAVDELSPCPVLPGLTINLAILLGPTAPEQEDGGVALVPIPGNLPRFVPCPATPASAWCGWRRSSAPTSATCSPAAASWRPRSSASPATPTWPSTRTRPSDLLRVVEDAVRERRRRSVVRLALPAGADAGLRDVARRLVPGCRSATSTRSTACWTPPP